MKPVAIIRFTQTEGPGYLADFLTKKNIPQVQINIDTGNPLPEKINGYSGLVLMGGPMSVNDDLPWIEPVLNLAREAVDHSIPVLGHCLGGQLMSRALGGAITRNPVKEIGWGRVSKIDDMQAVDWLGKLPHEFEVFQWHGETFTIPPNSRHLLKSQYCHNQAFLLDDLHLGLQCHIEMTAPMIRAWCDNGAEEIRESLSSPAVATAEAIQENITPRLQQLNTVADLIYTRWIKGLKP